MVRLHKQSNTKRYNIKGGVQTSKFFIQCQDPANIEEWLTNSEPIDVNLERAIVKAVIQDDRVTATNVVVKLSESLTIQKEYDISQALKDTPGFIAFICVTMCRDDLRRYHTSVKFCSDNPTDPETNLLVMPYISGGSMRAYKWDGHPDQLVACLLQLIASLATAFTQHGFLHSDIHLDNVLLRPTKKTSFIYASFGKVPAVGYQVCIMDFDRSFIGVNRTHTAEFYKDIQKVFHELTYTMRLDYTHQANIAAFLNERAYHNAPMDDLHQLLAMLRTITSVFTRQMPTLVYNPSVY